jgi:6-pyruvoyltetrahydropterin/6-carboxytetrahydropterin synthase
MFEVGVVGQFEAAHRLHGDFGPATRTHGHTYRVEVALRGDRLQDDGTLYDIARLQAALADVIDRVHLRDLDEVEGLAGANTTAERVAKYVFDLITVRLGAGPELRLKVRIWESPVAWAEYEGPADEGSCG